ncbi:glutaminyl-peptide cyclotransferase [Flavobacterium amniphilum]|uniref:glutaminyl-peptide cyclotransferase n=1 Tax=Flavobacterium amniphilum TaxID=1834035 RepID=UPI00202A9C22|nr:glutaminyl-peptide cyclotransferase [Flavobacterium amniphilum]MCL9804326.1 glutaminyl-peptide cyclotransferase [Flavobacterium amniphilum]
MKKYNLLAFTSLVLLLTNCAGDKKNLFSIDDSKFKLIYHQNDNVSLLVKNKKDKTIDSVVYFNGEKRIGSVKGNTAFNYSLKEQKLGYQSLKAVIYFEGDSTKTEESRIELVSHIEPKLLDYTILNTYPHDIKAYTQGLEFHKDTLFEGTGNGAGNGTGLRGVSSLRKTDYKTGKVLKKVELGVDYFGEGITVLNNKVYQLTWLNNEGYVYNADTFKKEKTFKYFKKMEGWGLTNDGKNLYQSDGTERITLLNPETFQEVDFINVYTANNKIKAVNELEWIDGKIYANIYQMDALAIIDPKSGAVEAVIDLSKLKSKVTQHPDVDVLNGIAYNPKTKTIFVTGKNWDKMFEIKINH